MRPAKIFVTHLESSYSGPLQKAFEWLSLGSAIKHGDSVVIKPNLTFPVFRPGVMTNPEAIEALIVYLKNYTDNITIAESDSGGYNRFSMDEVFAKTGILEYVVLAVAADSLPISIQEFLCPASDAAP